MDASQQQRVMDSTTVISRVTTRTTITAISRATVFDIPLLTDIIVQHLTTHDIYRCTLVSHQFHDAFQPRLYTSISIRQEAALDMFFREEAQAAFARHHSQVKEVSTAFGSCVGRLMNHTVYPFNLPPGQNLTSAVRNLTVLKYLPAGSLPAEELESCSKSILALITASPSLQVLHLSRFAHRSSYLMLGLAKVVREKGRQLKELRLYPTETLLSPRIFILMWSCAAVEVLQLGYGPIFRLRDHRPHAAESLLQLRAFAREALFLTDAVTLPAPTEAVEMTKISQDADKIEFAWKELGSGSWLGDPQLEDILEVLQMCPNLESMVIPRLSEQDVITHLAPVVAKGMPQLRHLDLTRISGQPLGTRSLVESCKGLISLNMEKLRFESRLLVDALVSRHGFSLEELRIHQCSLLSSQELNLILSHCRRLKTLYAMAWDHTAGWTTAAASPILDINDMAIVPEAPDWACKDIETLQLCYSGVNMGVGIPEVLWRQIGQLFKLKDLKLHRRAPYEEAAVQENDSVRQAVSSWAALSDLRRLELRALQAFVDEALVKQAKNQWPKLEWMQCTYS